MSSYTDSSVNGFLDTWLSQRAQQETLPGFTVAVRQGNTLIYEAAFEGFEQANPVRKSSIFNIGSQAKLLTATLILQAVQRNELTLEARVVQYLPWLVSHNDPRIQLITIEQLLWHGAGLMRDGLDSDYWQLIRPFPDSAMLRRLVLDSPLILRPGYKLKYSNLGYALLGEVLTAINNMEYATLISKYIAQPLKLSSLTARLDRVEKKRLAPGYTERISGTYVHLPTAIDTRAFASVTGCYATAGDMSKLVYEIVCGTHLLKHDTQKRLISGSRSHWIPDEQRGSTYGLGIMSLDIDGKIIVGHSGAMLAHRSATYTDPRTRTTVAVMSTSKQVPVNQILIGIFEVLDYFSVHQTAVPIRNERFHATLQNLIGTKHIMSFGDRVISIYLDDWSPFSQVEELDIVNDTTLKIVRAHDLQAESELVNYTFSGDSVVSVRFAGSSMWPKHIFTKWILQKTKPYTKNKTS